MIFFYLAILNAFPIELTYEKKKTQFLGSCSRKICGDFDEENVHGDGEEFLQERKWKHGLLVNLAKDTLIFIKINKIVAVTYSERGVLIGLQSSVGFFCTQKQKRQTLDDFTLSAKGVIKSFVENYFPVSRQKAKVVAEATTIKQRHLEKI